MHSLMVSYALFGPHNNYSLWHEWSSMYYAANLEREAMTRLRPDLIQLLTFDALLSDQEIQ